MVLKTNTRNSLVDDVYDVLISVSCAAAFKLVLLVVMVDVLGAPREDLIDINPTTGSSINLVLTWYESKGTLHFLDV
jgi:hypothetical protein